MKIVQCQSIVTSVNGVHAGNGRNKSDTPNGVLDAQVVEVKNCIAPTMRLEEYSVNPSVYARVRPDA